MVWVISTTVPMPAIEPVHAATDSASAAAKPIIAAETLPLRADYYPFGFPAQVRTNSARVLEQFDQLWGGFRRLRNTAPIQCEVQLVEDDSIACPPAPTYRLMMPLVIAIADENNFGVVDLERRQVKIAVSGAALLHSAYVQYCLLGTPAICVATSLAPAVHAACVALEGRGVLLCGDSGAGKSTLAYACARAGWTYVSDDAVYLLDGADRTVTGNCCQMRFRPQTAEIFSELSGHVISARPGGKPSIELSTAPMTHVARAQTARIDAIVFLNRRGPGSPRLIPLSKDYARRSMCKVLYGTPELLEFQRAGIERLLTAPTFELQYSDLDWAVGRLQELVAEGK
jgi:hypothetical protein